MIRRESLRPADRFWPKVSKTETCWIWTAGLNDRGYGVFYVGSKAAGTWRQILAHRWSYEDRHGPIPEGLVIDHLCRNPSCVNPAHLEPVTQRENTLRGVGPAALNARKTHCKNGHEFTSENTYVAPYRPNSRECRVCRAAQHSAWYRQRRVAGQ